MNTTKLILAKSHFSSLKQELIKAQKQIIKELFETIPNLEYLELEYSQEYNDNDYYDDFKIKSLNYYDSNISEYFLEDIDFDFSDHDSSNTSIQHPLMKETKLTIDEIETIIDYTLNIIDKSLFNDLSCLKLKRKEVLSEDFIE